MAGINLKIDLGHIERGSDNVYTNKTFSFKITLPGDWAIAGHKGMDFAVIENSQMNEHEERDFLKLTEQGNIDLFRAARHPFQTPGTDNPSITCTAQKISLYPQIKSGADYLQDLKYTLASGIFGIKVSINRDIHRRIFGAMDFDVLETSAIVGGEKVHTNYYSTIKRGYALSFVTTYKSVEGGKTLDEIINSIELG